jgi:energy-coupling factor transporter ATP-binding protein EcfA2
VGLKGWEHHTPSELSGGQQQRVAIARAIVTEPAVLLADEPTGNLDTQRSQEIMELLWRLNADHGITVLMVTHEPDMAAYARRIVRFVDGMVDSDAPNPHPVGLRAPVVAVPAIASRRSPDAAQHPAAGVALHPAQPDALVPHHSGHRDWCQRRHHHGDAGQWRHHGGAKPDFRPGHQPAAGAPWPAHGPGAAEAGAPRSRTPMPTPLRPKSAAFWPWRPRRGPAPRWWPAGRNWTSSIIGSTNAWLVTGNWTPAHGRVFSDAELRAGAAVCLIGETVRRELYGTRDRSGRALRVKAISCEVVGVLASKGQGVLATTRTTWCWCRSRRCSAV